MEKIVEKFREELYESLPKVVYRQCFDHSIEELHICNSDFLGIEDGRIYFWYRDKDEEDDIYEIYYLIDKGMSVDEMLGEYDLYSSKEELQLRIEYQTKLRLENLKQKKVLIESEIEKLNSLN